MKKAQQFLQHLFLFAALALLIGTGCRRNGGEVWEDTRTAGRHLRRGVGSLGGKHGDSRAISNREEFYPYYGGDFIPLPDTYDSNDVGMAEFITPQPREIPGDPGSNIPGIQSFCDPATSPEFAQVFKLIYFDYNSYLVKGEKNQAIIQNIAHYLRQHPNTYIFTEGHCDERGPEAFNLALGARRANAVRNLLIGDGINPDQIFTISYGKERPLVLEHHDEAWAQNRRVEFKIYQR